MGRGPGPTANRINFLPFGHNFRDDNGTLVRNAANPGFFTINAGAIQDDGGTPVPLNPGATPNDQLTFFTPAENDFFRPLNNPPLNPVKSTANFTSFAIIVVDDVQAPTTSRVQGGGSGSATSFTFTTDNIPVDINAPPVDLVVGGTSYQGWIYTIPTSTSTVTVTAFNDGLASENVDILSTDTGDDRKVYFWVESGTVTSGEPKPDVLKIGTKSNFETAAGNGDALESITGTSITSNVNNTFSYPESQVTLNAGVESEAVPLEETPEAGQTEPAQDPTLIDRFYTDNPTVRIVPVDKTQTTTLEKGESTKSVLGTKETLDNFSINLESTLFDIPAFIGYQITGNALNYGVSAQSILLVAPLVGGGGSPFAPKLERTITDRSGNELTGMYAIIITQTESSTIISTGIWNVLDDENGEEIDTFYPEDFIELNNDQKARINIKASIGRSVGSTFGYFWDYDITVSRPS